MPFGKGRRKLLWVLGIVLLLLAGIWFSVPFWFPLALRPLAARIGAHFAAYERIGYSHFRINELTLTNESLAFRAARIEAFVPTVWLWNLTARRSSSDPFVQLNDWTCELLPSNKPSSPANSQLQDAADALRTVQRWVPAAVLREGILQSGATKLTVGTASWREGTLEAEVNVPVAGASRAVAVELRPGHPFELHLACTELALDSVLEVATNQTGFDLQSTSFWQSNRFEAHAEFGRADNLPRSASLQATNWLVPATLARLPHYETIAGSLEAQWHEGSFEANLSAAARPGPTETRWPPAELDLQVRGDTNSATVQKLMVRSPVLQASLSGPTALGFSAPFLHSTAQLTLRADLNQQHWLDLHGQVTGTAQFAPGPRQFPVGRLQITGTGLGNTSLEASSVEVSANVNWPMAKITAGEAHFNDGSSFSITGEVDLGQKSVTTGAIRFAGPLARRWLPPGYSFGDFAMTGTFNGPIEKLSHSGQIRVSEITAPGWYPLALNLQWNGQKETLDRFSLALSNSNATLVADGRLDLSANQAELELSKVLLRTNSVSALGLTQPVTIHYTGPGAGTRWGFRTSPLHASGAAGELSAQAAVQWPVEGSLDFQLQRFPLALLAAFGQTDLPRIDVTRLRASAAWSNSPATLLMTASATGTPAPQISLHEQAGTQPASSSPQALPAQLLSTPLQLELSLAGDAHGLVLSNLLVNSPTSAVASAHGFLPVSIHPVAATNLLVVQMDEPLHLEASVRPEAYFWHMLSQIVGVRLDDPTVDLELSGTMRQPIGKVLARVRRIYLKQETLTNLALSDLRLAFSADRQAARLTEGQVMVQGQKVSFTGELPLDQNSWTELAHKKAPSLEKASGQLRIDAAQLAAFEPLFPEVLAPQGELNVNLTLHPGVDLEGEMILQHARTRPLGNTAPLRDINVTLRFHDRVLALENASAKLSGAWVELTGRADLRGTNWMAGGLPPFALTLHGTNVPLAHASDYIIRSDLDLGIIKTNDATPLVFGTAHLRDSFYLSDLSALVPRGVSTPSARPPFFSIDNPTLANWRLEVAVDGVRWLKLRTSLFNGDVSANLHLAGSLKDPIALGVLKVDSGLVRFPFANLQIQQGLVTLTSQDPYRPQLLVRAVSKQFGYDLRMEVTGSVDSPIIQFTSNPSLSSEQILLMITAGQLPQGSFTLTPQQRAQTVALFLGRDLLSKLGFGDQSQERLTISSGEEISVQNRPTYHVEYKLTPRWSVTGEYDRFGDFNAGFKWRIYSK